MTEILQPLSGASSSFAGICTNNQIYVDKTDLICRMAQGRNKYFLARPRRFGKSLLVTTLAELFAGNMVLFEKFKAKDLWHDRAYAVVRVDIGTLKKVASAEELQTRLNDKIIEWFSPVGFSFDADAPIGALDQLDYWLSTLAPSSLVVLVDEYDAPLTDKINDPALFEKLQAVLSSFFYLFKSNDKCLRFFFMTGITKFRNTGIFSELNDLDDISLWEEYGTLLGYTESEIKTYFGGYLRRAATTLEMSTEKLLCAMRRQYDGFCFEETCTHHVYAPWSVQKFLESPQRGLRNYWYDSAGQSAALMKYLAVHRLAELDKFEKEVVLSYDDLNGSQELMHLNQEAIMAQTGYLTLKSVTPNQYFYLGSPNEEVAQSLVRLFSEQIIPEKSILARMWALPRVMETGSLDEMVEDYFNPVFLGLDYLSYPVANEAACRVLLQVLLEGAALLPRSEVHNAKGRSDLEVSVGKRHWVFELKFVKTASEEAAALSEAIKQMEDRHYGESTARNRELCRAALVFNGEEKRFTRWQTL